MSLLNRTQSGLLYEADFRSGAQLDTRVWNLSPSDPSRFELTSIPGELVIHPDNVYGEAAMMLMTMPAAEQFVMEISNQFNPSPDGDMAGMIAYTTNEVKIELLQYYDASSGPVSYTHQRIQYKDGIFTGWGSPDDGVTWHLLGSDTDSYAMIGLVLYSPVIEQATPQNITSTMGVDYVRIFSNNGITVSNLTEGMSVKLIDVMGNLVTQQFCGAKSNSLFLSMTNLTAPVTGKLQTSDAGGQVIDETDIMNLYPGDEFWFGPRMHLLWNEEDLVQDQDTYLGMLDEGHLRTMMYVYNPDTIPYYNVQVSIDPWLNLRRLAMPGTEWIALAADVSGSPSTFTTSINVGTVQPGERVPFWIDIQRPTTVTTRFEGNFRFKLRLVDGGAG